MDPSRDADSSTLTSSKANLRSTASLRGGIALAALTALPFVAAGCGSDPVGGGFGGGGSDNRIPRPVLVVLHSGDGAMSLYDTREQKEAARFSTGGIPVDVAVATDGGRAFVRAGGSVRAFDIDVGGLVSAITGSSLGDVAPDPDGELWIAAGVGLIEVSVETGEVRRRVTLDGSPNNLRIDENQGRLFGSIGGRIIVVDIEAAELLMELELGVAPLDVGIAPDGTVYVTAQHELIELSSDLFTVSRSFQFPAQLSPIEQGFLLREPRVRVNQDGSTIVLTLPAQNEVVALDAETLAETWRTSLPSRPDGLAVGTDGFVYVALPEMDRVAVLDLATGVEASEITRTSPTELDWVSRRPASSGSPR